MSAYTPEDAERDATLTLEGVARRLRSLREESTARVIFNEEQEAAGAETWDIRPLSEVEERHEPEPTVCEVEPGRFAFFPGQINWLYGDNDSAKTWLALWTVAEAVRAGHSALVLEYEMDLGKVKSRLSILGAPRFATDRHVIVARPATATTDTLRRRLQAAFETVGPPAVVVIDAVAASLSTAGLDSNTAADVEAWVRDELRWMFDCWPDTALLVIDHTPHSGGHATGSKRKADAADAIFRVEMPKHSRITRTSVGCAVVRCEKDRGGYHPYDQDLFLLVGGGGGPWSVRSPGTTDKSSGRDQRQKAINAFGSLAADAALTYTELRKLIGGKSTRCRVVVDELIDQQILEVRLDKLYGRGVKYPT